MKKGKFLAPRNAAREILSDSDAQRMLDSGSWVIATIPKKPTRHSIAQKEFEQRRREAGFRKLQVLLPEHVFGALNSRRQEGESMAMLLERLISESDINEKSMEQGDK